VRFKYQYVRIHSAKISLNACSSNKKEMMIVTQIATSWSASPYCESGLWHRTSDTGWSIGVVGGETLGVTVAGPSFGVAGGVVTAVTTRGSRMVVGPVRDTAGRILMSSGSGEVLWRRVLGMAMVIK